MLSTRMAVPEPSLTQSHFLLLIAGFLLWLLRALFLAVFAVLINRVVGALYGWIVFGHLLFSFSFWRLS